MEPGGGEAEVSWILEVGMVLDKNELVFGGDTVEGGGVTGSSEE